MDKKLSKSAKGVIFTLLGGTCWGFSGTCGQYLFTRKNIESGWLTMVRMITAGIVLITFLLIKREKGMKEIWKNKRDVFNLLLFAVFGLLFSQYTYLTAIFYSNAGTVTVLQYLNPVMIMLLVCMVSKRIPNKIEMISVILAVSGTFLIATHGNIHSLSISKEGLFWGLLSAVAAVSYSLLPGRIISKWGSLLVTGYAMLIGGLFFGILSGQWKTKVVFDTGTVLGVLASIEPVAASLFSFLWLKTPFISIDIIGFAFIMTTVFLLSKKSKMKN